MAAEASTLQLSKERCGGKGAKMYTSAIEARTLKTQRAEETRKRRDAEAILCKAALRRYNDPPPTLAQMQKRGINPAATTPAHPAPAGPSAGDAAMREAVREREAGEARRRKMGHRGRAIVDRQLGQKRLRVAAPAAPAQRGPVVGRGNAALGTGAGKGRPEKGIAEKAKEVEVDDDGMMTLFDSDDE
mmetsp:Transcript_8191/g.20445  ORF Transcript_8191/g.20445 Transcript_8191/m.20445 type:complete len:188 (-) Transcript_8191:45-608(-)